MNTSLTQVLDVEFQALAALPLDTPSLHRVHTDFMEFVRAHGLSAQDGLAQRGIPNLSFYWHSNFRAWDIDRDLAAFADQLYERRDWRTLSSYGAYAETILSTSFNMDSYFQEDILTSNERVPFPQLTATLRKMREVLLFRRRDIETLYQKLREQNVPELEAEMITLFFEDLGECNPATASKNIVYHIADEQRVRKVLKFVPSSRRHEADMEALVLREFKGHSVLRQYVPKIFDLIPFRVPTGLDEFDLIIQEDVSRKSAEQPVEYWMKALAHIHIFGTAIMDGIENYAPALSLTKEKDEARLEASGLNVDKILHRDLAQQGIETGTTFIHQDIRRQNRVGQYAIDWGHAGRGNPYLDLARVLLDSQVQQGQAFSSNDYKKYLALYLTERGRVQGASHPITASEVESAYLEFRKISLLYAQAQGAYLHTKGLSCSLGEARDFHFLSIQIPVLERELTALGSLAL